MILYQPLSALQPVLLRAMTSYKVVDNVSACQRAVKRLEQEEFIAVDSEGVNLSRTGPLTLLQIGTVRHRVYLFDVMREPRMFQDGGLKRLLESESVVKVRCFSFKVDT